MATQAAWSTAPRLAPSLVIRRLRKSFARGLARAAHRTVVLVDVDLELWPGEIVALTGAMGSGKTTLLQCAAGLLRCDSGDIQWFGDRFEGGGPVPGVAYVPSVPTYYPFLAVRDVIEYRLQREMLPRAGSHHLMHRALGELDLDRIASRPIATLGPDELERVAFAEALATDPAVLLIDDVAGRAGAIMSDCARRAIRSHAIAGGSVVIAARDSSLLSLLADAVFLLEGGRLCCGRRVHRRRPDVVRKLLEPGHLPQ